MTYEGMFDEIECKFELERQKKYIQKCIIWCQKFNIPYNNVIQTNNMFLAGSAARLNNV